MFIGSTFEHKMLKVIFAVVIFFSIVSEAKEQILCPTVIFKNKVPFKFTDDELRLICGDKQNDSISTPWANIPPSQAKLYLTATIQTHGYHKAVFENRGGILYVDLGQPTFISKILTEGAPAPLDINRKREIKGEKLTPAKLNELQDWVSMELKHIGYPCPQVDVTADFLTGELLVRVAPGYHSKIIEVDSDPVGDLHAGVVRRYDAFHVGEDFDIYDITLTERRAMEDDLIIGSHFDKKCSADGVRLHQTIQAGLPRLFRIGVGFDTEQGPSFRVSAHYSRMNQRGSSLDNTLTTSLRIQDFLSSFNWYFLRNPSRFYLKPVVEVKRDKEEKYEYLETRISFLPSASWDDGYNRWDISLGPAYQADQTVVGVGPKDSRNIFLNQSLIFTSHAYEYFISNPQRGYRFSVESLSSNKALASSVSASKVTLMAESLWNAGKFSPPVLVVGIRGLLSTTYTPNGNGDLLDLPVSMRSFLGGTKDLRGFSRQELPDSNPAGSMTEVYVGSEARFPSVLPWGLQPFVFLDGGLLGNQPNTLQWPLYWNPGLGLRWASPIGTFRVEAAHGFVDSPLGSINGERSHWQFYVSYGEEF